ncbi:MAG: hypothetical protein ACK4GR_03230 [bacterium]
MLPIKKRKSIGQHLIVNKDSGKYVLTIPILQKLKNYTFNPNFNPNLIRPNEIDYIKILQFKS